jgi:hypothetical protein
MRTHVEVEVKDKEEGLAASRARAVVVGGGYFAAEASLVSRRESLHLHQLEC